MKQVILLSASILVLAALCTGIPITPLNFQLIGQVNGKFFFYETVGTNWTEAISHCEEAGLHIAEISTLDEMEFLISHGSSSTFTGWYWTAGADAMTLQQFVWTRTGSQVIPNLPHKEFSSRSTCLTYDSNAGQLDTRPCASTVGLVLCEFN